ncbi:MAG: methionyl-tRNA formyltransferase [Steroidobacteraceae bacterium]
MDAPQSPLTLGFAGTAAFAVPALDALARSGHAIRAVLTKADRPSGRGRTMHKSPVKQRALELGIPVHQPLSFKTPEACEMLRALRLDALIVVAYGLILPPEALGAPRLGCFNIHASLLPRWRGAAPVQRAILAGDSVTGITIMHMDAGLDTGPIVSRREIDISPLDTAGSLHDRLAVLGGELICQTLDDIAAGRAREVPQPQAGHTYADKISKSEALIDWQEDAARILRRIRALNPSPVAETRLDGVQVRIWQAQIAPDGSCAEPISAEPGTVLRATSDGIDVACGRGRLRIERLQLAGRKPLAASDFIKAQRLPGARFTRS